MPVLINFKICDNSPFCDGISACPTGALYFDSQKGKICIDQSKCIECGKCTCCSVGAIHFVNQNIIKKYEVKTFPALLFFNKGEFMGNVEGYYDISEVDKPHREINKITRKINKK
ncbi:MAG TPA: hypothetical protein PLL26_03535 [Candidatus Dojkabacteria bacterium]|nr:hypothetical protein [Candidatus Dojkabacteria bacterium]